MRLRRAPAAVLLLLMVSTAFADATSPAIDLKTGEMGPRSIEDLTRGKILRDYSAAWASLDRALEENRAGLLDEYFTGFAHTQFARAIAEQNATGIHRRYTDRGHRLEGVFYAPDGGMMELRDTAQYDEQIYDGGRLLSSRPVTATLLVVMTPAADRWMVRILQEIPSPQNPGR